MLNKLLVEYGDEICKNIVINIEDVSIVIARPDQEHLQSYKHHLLDQNKVVEPYTLIHHTDSKLPKFVLIDNCHKTPIHDYRTQAMLPFAGNSWPGNTIYIIAGSGSWTFDYGNEELLHRNYYHDDLIAESFKTVQVNKLANEDIATLTNLLGLQYIVDQSNYLNLYCDGRFFFIDQMMQNIKKNGSLSDYYIKIFSFINTKFKHLRSNIKTAVWNAIIETIYFNSKLSPQSHVYDLLNNTLEIIDTDNSIIPPFEESLIHYFRNISTDQVNAFSSSLSKYFFEASFMPIFLNSEKKLGLEKTGNEPNRTNLSFTNVFQLLKSNLIFNDISTSKTFKVENDAFYLLSPRFPVIDGFVVISGICWAVQMSNSPYSSHRTKEPDLHKMVNSSDYPFLKTERVDYCLTRITGIALKNIRYVYMSPEYIAECPKTVYQMPEGWIIKACEENKLLEPFKKYWVKE